MITDMNSSGNIKDRNNTIAKQKRPAETDEMEPSHTKYFRTNSPKDKSVVPVGISENRLHSNERNSPESINESCQTVLSGVDDSGEASDSMEYPEVDGHSNEAEEIVQKLCKNGKIMQFQEGEDYIKVIVYEDSQDNDAEETLSAEEIENSLSDSKKGEGGQIRPRNLLEHLTGEKEDQRLEDETEDFIANVVGVSQDHSSGRCENETESSTAGVGASSQAAAIQSNFSYAVSQFAPSFQPSLEGHLATSTFVPSHAEMGAQPSVSGSTMSQRLICTPHPSSGFMFYVAEDSESGDQARTPFATVNSSFRPFQPNQAHKMVTPDGRMVQLNSSGEENTSPPEILDTPTSGHMQQKVRSYIPLPEYPIDECGKLREQHNQKERRRRARIKEACNLLRQLVPGMSDKTDKATVFEFAARYVHFLKSHTGTQFDKDFLMKYSPY